MKYTVTTTLPKWVMFTLTSSFFLLNSSFSSGGNTNSWITNDSNHPIPITGTISAATGGAAHEANSQVTASTSAATLAIARPTRVGCLVTNLDTSITVYVGAATVTAGNGLPLKAGQSVVITAQTLIQVIAASGSPVVAIFDEYN